MNLKSHGSFWATLAEKHLRLKGYADRRQLVWFKEGLHRRRGILLYFEYRFLAKGLAN